MRGAALQVPSHWRFMPLASVDEAGVQDTWYTVLDTTNNVRLYSIVLRQSNDETATKFLAHRVTIDNVSITLSSSSLHTTNYYYYLNPVTDSSLFRATTYNLMGFYTALHGCSVKVEVRSTSAAGTNQHLYGYVRYAVLGVAPS